MSESDIIFRRASAAATDWYGRIVYESAANTVSLSDDPTSEIPLGVISSVDEDTQDVGVTISGRAYIRVGAGGLTAGTDNFVAAKDGASAAADGKATPAQAGEYYAARVNIHADASEDDLVPCHVGVGQLDSDT